ncbi:hypothetical protein [Aquimarina brevivitae]|uniref:Uncharacterized protein n=1 Tax=Aquimarina brevivitae TaxID=323412 RepID=A0A4Q7P1D7_9FLAO|nr:hypothetical protein [Aquimarina brevivitae]RZS93524.1 hypothetical protein EV197_2104 [Aquimarina brevivitae]
MNSFPDYLLDKLMTEYQLGKTTTEESLFIEDWISQMQANISICENVKQLWVHGILL